MPKPVGNLHAADAGHIVLIGIQVAALGYAAEPAALRPGEVRVVRPVVPVEGVGRVGIGNRAGYAVTFLILREGRSPPGRWVSLKSRRFRESGDFAGNQGEINVSGASQGTVPVCSRVPVCSSVCSVFRIKA